MSVRQLLDAAAAVSPAEWTGVGLALAYLVLAVRQPLTGLARLSQLIADAGASIKEVIHDRAFSGPDVSAVHVQCAIETADREHQREVLEHLEREGISLVKQS